MAEPIVREKGDLKPPGPDAGAIELDSSTAVSMMMDWTPAEEAAARFKIDVFLMPLLILGFFGLQIDRTNIGSALTSTITDDLGVTTDEINVGNQLLSAGIFLLEIPSNFLLMRAGPRLWLTCQVFAWGMVATFQAFMSSYASYLATRFLLGALEAGFIPGCLYLMGSWYTRAEYHTRVTTFYLGQNFASATSSLLGAGLLQLHGHLGLEGWRWLFLVDGFITLFAGVLFLLFLPPHVGNGRPLASTMLAGGRWSYFTEKETRILKLRVVLDDPAKESDNEARLGWADVVGFMKKPRKWMHILITLTSVCAAHSLSTYGPRILKSSGFSTTRANLLYSVSAYSAMVFNFALAWLSAKADWSFPFILLAVTWNVTSYSTMTQLESYDKWDRYTSIVISSIPYSAVHALNVGWMSKSYESAQDRSVSSAFIIMASNLAGIPAGQIFRDNDAPLYSRGTTVLTSLAGGCWLAVCALGMWEWRVTRKPKF